MVAPEWRGSGLGAAALRAVCALGFGDLALHRLQAEVYGFNHTALATFERAGFQREGVRRRAYHRHGGWQDGIHLGRLADDPIRFTREDRDDDDE
jgi:RimJ/RimL family protein N-acetyltransferase